MRRHIVLVGLPGSGKSTVGRRVAELLGTALTDVDERVEVAAGRSVSEIFAAEGEAGFRAMERSAMAAALAAAPHVVAPGAGWIAEPGNLEAATGAGAHLVYLRVTAFLASARLRGDGARPLLAGADRGERMAALFRARDGWYQRAASRVDGSAGAAEVAEAVAAIARDAAGW